MCFPGSPASRTARRAMSGCARNLSSESTAEWLFDVAARFDPAAKSGGHRRDIFVAHFSESYRGKCRAVAGRAVDDEVCVPGNDGLHLRLEVAARDVRRTRDLAEVYFLKVA